MSAPRFRPRPRPRPQAEPLEGRALLAVSFEGSALATTGRPANSLAAADFNGDGIPDLIEAGAGVSDSSGNSVASPVVALRIGRGDGTFADPTLFDQTGFSPRTVLPGDFNGDGRLDFVVLQNQYKVTSTPNHGVDPITGLPLPPTVHVDIPSTIQFFRNQGDGTFQPQAAMPINLDPHAAVAADFSGDGRLDLVIDHAFYRGNGDGTFAQPVDLVAPDRAAVESEAVADLNGDGRPDLLLGVGPLNDSEAQSTPSGRIEVWAGRGDGTFDRPVNVLPATETISEADQIVVGDFDNDGRPDLAIQDAPFTVLRNNGDGTFTAGPHYDLGYPIQTLAAADFDRDGRLDLAVTNRLNNQVQVILGRGDGTFVANVISSDPDPIAQTSGFRFYSTVRQAADVNGDGILDEVRLLPAGYSRFSFNLSVRLGRADGTLGPALPTQSVLNDTDAPSTNTLAPPSLNVGDVNGDGRPDLIVGSLGAAQRSTTDPTQYDHVGQGISVLLGQGNGTFTRQTRIVGENRGPLSTQLADIDGDGLSDIVELDDLFDADNPNGTGQQLLSVRLSRGDGTFAPPVDVDLGSSDTHVGVTVADLDGDGRPEILVTDTTTGGLEVFGNGSTIGSVVLAAPRFLATGVNPVGVEFVDLTGDGVPDLVVANEGNGFRTDNLANSYATVVLLPGLGGGGFGLATVIDSRDSTQQIALEPADVDGDRRVDLVVAYQALNGPVLSVVRVLKAPGSGTGLPTFLSEVETVNNLDRVGVGDVNHDGRADLLIENSASTTVALGQGGGTFLQPNRFAVVPSAGPIVAADLDGDGRPDLVTLSTGDGAGTVLRNTSDATPLPFTVTGQSFRETVGDPPVDQLLALVNDADPRALSSDYRATVDWGDGSAAEAARVIVIGSGQLAVLLGHAYARAGTYTARVTIRNTTRNLATVATTTATVDATPVVNPGGPGIPVGVNPGGPNIPTTVAPPILLGGLDPFSDSGASATDRITDVNRPTFRGVADPGATVEVYVQRINGLGQIGAFVRVGQTVAAADGLWAVATDLLADGSYTVTLLASPTDKAQTLLTVASAASPLVIDTTPPTIESVTFGPAQGRVFVSFVDGSALVGPALLQRTSYRAGSGSLARRLAVTGVSAVDGHTIRLTLRNGRAIPVGSKLALRVDPTAVTDAAGNSLNPSVAQLVVRVQRGKPHPTPAHRIRHR